MVLSTLWLTSLTIKATALLVMPPSSPHQDPPLLAPPQHPPVLPPPPPSSKPKLLSRLCPFTPSQCNTSSSLRLLNFPRHTALPRPTMDTATMPLPESAAAVNRKSLDTTVPVTFWNESRELMKMNQCHKSLRITLRNVRNCFGNKWRVFNDKYAWQVYNIQNKNLRNPLK